MADAVGLPGQVPGPHGDRLRVPDRGLGLRPGDGSGRHDEPDLGAAHLDRSVRVSLRERGESDRYHQSLDVPGPDRGNWNERAPDRRAGPRPRTGPDLSRRPPGPLPYVRWEFLPGAQPDARARPHELGDGRAVPGRAPRLRVAADRRYLHR